MKTGLFKFTELNKEKRNTEFRSVIELDKDGLQYASTA